MVLQRNRANRMCVWYMCVCTYISVLHFIYVYITIHTHTHIHIHKEKERFIFWNWLTWFWRLKFKSSGRPADWRAREDLQFEFNCSLLSGFLLAQGRPGYVLLRPLVDWMKLTYIMEDNLIYLKSTDLNLISYKRHLHGKTRLMFEHVSGHWSPAKLTRNIKHHSKLYMSLQIVILFKTVTKYCFRCYEKKGK